MLNVALAGESLATSFEEPLSGLVNLEVKSNQPWGQTFSYTSGNGTYDVSKVGVVLQPDPSVPAGETITVSLRASWNGPNLGSATIATEDLLTFRARYEFDLGSVTLNDATTYYLRIDNTYDGQVHLGVVHVFDVETPAVRPREADIVNSGFQTIPQLLADIEQFETWSQICLRTLFA